MVYYRGSFSNGRPSKRGEKRGQYWHKELGLRRGRYAFHTNSLYKVGNSYYITDDVCARLKYVVAFPEFAKVPRHPSQQRAVGKMVNITGDNGGHILASSLGGSGQAINMVPMRSSVNLAGGAWSRMEARVRGYLREHTNVIMFVELMYENDESLRPASFIVKILAGNTLLEDVVIDN